MIISNERLEGIKKAIQESNELHGQNLWEAYLNLSVTEDSKPVLVEAA